MKRTRKKLTSLKLTYVLFVAVSLISVTLAWFAYSSLTQAKMDIDVKAWYFTVERNGEPAENRLVITVPKIYPGMEPVTEKITMKNQGDADAAVNYEIVSARLLGNPQDNFVINDETTSPYVEDLLAHEYPFHINMNLDKNYAKAKTGESTLEVSVSWPLDSGNDTADSTWGTNAYLFQEEEENKQTADPNYQMQPSLQIIVYIKASQYTGAITSSDFNYNLGDNILFDVVTNQKCTTLGENCLSTTVLDIKQDGSVLLLPSLTTTYANGPYSAYDTLLTSGVTNWNASTATKITKETILKAISTDVINSVLVRNNLSNKVIGSLKYGTRLLDEVNNNSGHYEFSNEIFPYLASETCYWLDTEYDVDYAWAVKNMENNKIKLYPELKTNNCNVVPLVEASEASLN